MTVSSPCHISWKELWICIILELNREASAFSRVYYILYDVWQSITRCKTSVDSEDKITLMIRLSYCFLERKDRLITGAAIFVEMIWEGGQEQEL